MLKQSISPQPSRARRVSDPTGRIIKSVQAKHDALRSLPERIADTFANLFGSVIFFMANFLWFFLWIIVNMGFVSSIRPFDPFPFGLLTMIVSLEAIFLSICVLISQNRLEKVNSLREEVDLQVDIITERELTKIMHLVVLLLHKNGIDLANDQGLKKMLKELNTTKIEKILEQQIT